MIALYIVLVVVLLILVWDLNARRSLKQFRLVDPVGENQPQTVSPLLSDPVLSYAKFFYETAFKKKSDFDRALTMLNSKDKSKLRVGMFFGRHFIFCWSPRVHKEVLMKESFKFEKVKNVIKSFDDLFGESIFAVEGEKWKNQKQILSASFHHEYIRNLTPVFSTIADKLCAKLDNYTKTPGTFEPYEWLSKMTLDAIGKGGFGFDFNAMENEMTKEYKAYETVVNSFTNPFRLISFYGKLPLKANKEYNDAVKVFQDWSHATIKKKLEKKLGDENSDLLDLMVQSNSDASLSTTELLHNIFLFFLAGHETTSGTLTAVLYFLSRHPDIQEKAREEVISIFGKSSEPSFDDIKSLQYLNQVINEASRLLGPVPGVSRLAKEDCTLDGYFIPKGTFIICSFSNTHHDPDIWGEDVNEFNPDRWSPEKVKERPNNSFNPFGAGSRICLGQSFANLEMRITLIKLLQKFKFGISTPELIIPRAITVRPQPGFLLSISKLN